MNLSSDQWKNVSTDAKIMLKRSMLTYRPEDRMQAHELLEHNWILLFARNTEISQKHLRLALMRLRCFHTEKKL